MLFKRFQTKAVAVALGLAVFSLSNAQVQAAPQAIKSSDLIAKGESQEFVTPVQLFAQATDTITPTLNTPISFSKIDIRENIKIEDEKSVFKVEHSGFYVIEPTLNDIRTPLIGQSFTTVVQINGKNYVYFEQVSGPFFAQTSGREERRGDALFLKKGDKISVALINAPEGTTVGARQLQIFNQANSKN